MQKDLFSGQIRYTIDMCSLLEMFRDGRKYPRGVFRSLFEDVCNLVSGNIIVSHIEVFNEIKNGSFGKTDELYKWALNNKYAFKDYDMLDEPNIIKQMSSKYTEWVNDKLSSTNADPWLIAQAKCNNWKIITEEGLTTGSTPRKKIRIPDVCKDFGVKCINLLELIIEQRWSY